MPNKIIQTAKISDDYLDLVRRFPLVPIRDNAHLKQAIRMIDELSVIDEEKLSTGQAGYLRVLSDLVEKFEDAHFSLEAAFDDGVSALKFLLEQHQMTASDLGRLLGNRQVGAAILRRARQLSKANVLKLAAHFNVTADLLLRERMVANRRAS
jgi:HTH-type transcriptional regulator/antitoxin HigA